MNLEVIPFTRSRTISQADRFQELERVSNLWLKQKSRCFAKFEGQAGYAAFSVS